jgi:hypothetical protein
MSRPRKNPMIFTEGHIRPICPRCLAERNVVRELAHAGKGLSGGVSYKNYQCTSKYHRFYHKLNFNEPIEVPLRTSELPLQAHV